MVHRINVADWICSETFFDLKIFVQYICRKFVKNNTKISSMSFMSIYSILTRLQDWNIQLQAICSIGEVAMSFEELLLFISIMNCHFCIWPMCRRTIASLKDCHFNSWSIDYRILSKLPRVITFDFEFHFQVKRATCRRCLGKPSPD